MNAQQCEQALIREREMHYLKMQGLQNQMELQYKTRLNDKEQTHFGKIKELENRVGQLNHAGYSQLQNQGYFPARFSSQGSGVVTLTPGPCQGGCGPRPL